MYAGRLLTIGLLGGSAVTTELPPPDPPPAAPTIHLEAIEPQDPVLGGAPPFPQGSALEITPPGPAAGAPPQIARPDEDIAVEVGWTPFPTTPTTLWDKLDEVTADEDTTYALNSVPVFDKFEVGLTTLVDPQTSTGHVLRVRARKFSAGPLAEATYRLKQGVTVIASVTHQLPATYETKILTLSAAEADAITDYSDLRVEVETVTAPVNQQRVTKIEFEVPAAPAAESVAVVEPTDVRGEAPPFPAGDVVTPDYFRHGGGPVLSAGSRTANSIRAAQGTENVDFQLPINTLSIVLGTGMQDDHSAGIAAGANVTLQFRRGTDAFATVVTASGEVRLSTATTLTEGNPVVAAERLSTGLFGTYRDGKEVETTNPSTHAVAFIGDTTEFQWSLSFNNALAGTKYDFRVIWETLSGDFIVNYISISTAAVVEWCQPHFVAGDAPPFPQGSVVEPDFPGPAPAAPPTISHDVLEPTIAQGDAPPFPAGAAVDPSGHQTDLHPDEPTFNQHVEGQVVAGDAPPFPAGAVVDPSGHQTDLHPDEPTFNQHVEGQVVVGDAPPFPQGRVVVPDFAGPTVTISHDVLEPAVVHGGPPPFPAGDVVDPSGHQTDLHPDEPTFNQHVEGQIAAGDPPPFPAGAVVDPSGHRTELHPTAPTIHHEAIEPQVVVGDAPPFPQGRALEIAPPGPTPAAPEDISHDVLEPDVVHGAAPPFPQGRALESPTPAAPGEVSHDVLEPDVVHGAAPPFPAGAVVDPSGHRTELHPTAPTINHEAIEPQVVVGDAPPFPIGSSELFGQTHTGAEPAPPPDSVLVAMPTDAYGEAPPFPAGDTSLSGQFHTGAVAPPVAPKGRGFLSRPFLG